MMLTINTWSQLLEYQHGEDAHPRQKILAWSCLKGRKGKERKENNSGGGADFNLHCKLIFRITFPSLFPHICSATAT